MTDASTPTRHDRTPPRSPARARGPLRALLDLFSSVWLGIWTLVALFVYMSIGSALIFVREMRVFELSEFEWFNWWPFLALIALLCVNLVVATLRRIPFNTLNLGVWTIHSGIIIMSLGSVYYFATKIEGDTPVFRRAVLIESPEHETLTMPALPGAFVETTTRSGQPVRYSVSQTDPNWPLLSGADAGKQVFSVSVLVQRGEAARAHSHDLPVVYAQEESLDAQTVASRAFVRQLLDGYPQYTEDVVPGRGRARNAVGTPIVDDSLRITLAHDAQEWYHLVHTWAVYTREVGASGEPLTEWTQRALPTSGAGAGSRMPRYNDYLVNPSEVWLPFGDYPIEPDPLRVVARSPGTDDAGDPDPFADLGVRITGYLRYAPDETRRVEGDPSRDPLHPFAVVRLSGRGLVAVYELEAFSESRASVQDGNLVFRWLDDASQLDRLGRGEPASITVSVPGADTVHTFVLDGVYPVGASASPRPIGDSGYTLRVKGLIDELPLTEDLRVSFADVEIATPEGDVIRRWIADDPAITNDIATPDPDNPAVEARVSPDMRVVTTYQPPRFPPAVTLAASREAPDSPVAILGVFGGDPLRIPLRPGSAVQISDAVTLELLRYGAHSRQETRPRLIPREQRDRDLGNQLAQARLEVTPPGASGAFAFWIPYSHHIIPGDNYTYGGRFPFVTRVFDLPGGRRVEIAFSRERRRLPAPVTLDDFVLHAHIGGFTGDTASIRDWESVLRFGSQAQGDEPVRVRTNEPGQYSGFRFFQAMWDPPSGPQTGAPSAGLNFTGLGIGNRNGVYTMLLGGTLSVLGSIYAFYVKPVIKRRRAAAVRARIEAGEYGERARERMRAKDHDADATPVGAEGAAR